MNVRPRVAIVGGGIAGLGAAHALADTCDVELFEASDWLGGHANTRTVTDSSGAARDVDTGFIVYNERTYPELIRLFDQLDVPTQLSDMSMSISCAECGIEYAGRRPRSIIQALLRRPRRMGRLARGITRFLSLGMEELRDADPAADAAASLETLDAWTRRHGIDDIVRSHFIVPLLAAVWSTPPSQTLDMPARTVLRFLANHGLLGREGVQWRTVTGGSRAYVERLRASLEARAARIHLATPVARVHRIGPGVEIETGNGARMPFDHVVIAAHADDALALLDVPTQLEREVLGVWEYTRSEAVLHSSEALLPAMRAAHASWNYRLPDCAAASGPPTLTYSMRTLQGVGGRDHWCVTLNDEGQVPAEAQHYRASYSHPRFTAESVATQALLPELLEEAEGTLTSFCGAWQRYGFHEDGLHSGLTVGRHVSRMLAARGKVLA